MKLKFSIRFFALSLLLVTTASFAAPWLGLSFKKTTFENHLALDIKGVHPESGCFAVGVTSGDLLVGVNGKPLTDMSQIQSAISGHKAGDKIKLEISRDGKKRTVMAALTEQDCRIWKEFLQERRKA